MHELPGPPSPPHPIPRRPPVRTFDPALFTLLAGDGRPLLSLTGMALLVSGLFAIFLAARREFLPHDLAFLGLDARQLCHYADCRIVGFMFHDRVSFGGTLLSIGVIYVWLAADPLQAGARWAWRAFALSGGAGFLSFLTYLGYGYLDTWHGVATLALLPCFLWGLALSARATRTSAASPDTRGPSAEADTETDAAATSAPRPWRAESPRVRVGRWCLLATALGLILAGSTILILGMTVVFVPTDLAFMRVDRDALHAISPRLIPLIAHDRAGFGGGLLSSGLLIAVCAWHAESTRAFRQAMTLSGLAGFGCAIGVHFVEGYTDAGHLAPAVAGAGLFAMGTILEALGARGYRAA
jgi:hypothetical protein